MEEAFPLLPLSTRQGEQVHVVAVVAVVVGETVVDLDDAVFEDLLDYFDDDMIDCPNLTSSLQRNVI